MGRENELRKLRKSILILRSLMNILRKLACVMLGCSVLSYLSYLLSKIHVIPIMCSISMLGCFMFIGTSGLIDLVSLAIEYIYEKNIKEYR